MPKLAEKRDVRRLPLGAAVLCAVAALALLVAHLPAAWAVSAASAAAHLPVRLLPAARAAYPLMIPAEAAVPMVTALTTAASSFSGGAAEPVFRGVEALSSAFASPGTASGMDSVKVSSPLQPSWFSSSWVAVISVSSILS